VCEQTNVDEGDVARLLRRVCEYLGQLGSVPYLSQALLDSAREAQRLCDRPPISDLVE
jgi:superfamily II RNA helicase